MLGHCIAKIDDQPIGEDTAQSCDQNEDKHQIIVNLRQAKKL
jgi:hypothetical protein